MATRSRRSVGDKPGRRLVEQDEARRAGQCQRDLQLPLLAVAERRHQRVGDAVEMHGVDDRFRLHHVDVVTARTQQRKAPPRDAAAGEKDAVADAQAAEQLRDLIGAPHAAADALMRRQVGDVLAEEADAAGRRQEIAGHGVEQRRLAGAVGAEDRAPFAGRDPHIDAGERHQRAEMPRHAFELERMRAGALETCRQRSFGHWRLAPQSLTLRAARIVAADHAELQELVFGNAERLVDLRHHLDQLVVEIAVGAFGAPRSGRCRRSHCGSCRATPCRSACRRTASTARRAAWRRRRRHRRRPGRAPSSVAFMLT